MNDFSKIPVSMRIELQRWGCWRLEDRKGRTTKVPYSVLTGYEAGSTRPEEWTDFAAAASFFVNRRKPLMDGLAFRLGAPFAGVDLDNCRDPETGDLHPKAVAIIADLSSYSEVSPSGTGVKVFLCGALPPGRRKLERVFGNDEHSGIEMYDSGRYFCVTGLHLEGSPLDLVERSSELERLHKDFFKEPERLNISPVHTIPTSLEDNQLIAKMLGAKNGAAIWRLWNGDASAYGSLSEADLALVSHIAFYAGPTPARIDAIFRQSRLVREKWDEQHGAETYGVMTIAKALSQAREFYRPSVTSGVRSEGLPWWPSPNPPLPT